MNKCNFYHYLVYLPSVRVVWHVVASEEDESDANDDLQHRWDTRRYCCHPLH